MTGGTSNLPPFAAMAIPSFTNVRKGVAAGRAVFRRQQRLRFHGSLFYGGKIADNLGAFAQGTYDNAPDTIHWDNTDIRYAKPTELLGREAVFGVSLNNNPTVNDVWNSTPAWGYPYLASELAPTPVAHPLIENNLAQQVIGVVPYIYWNRLVYAEFGGYQTLAPWPSPRSASTRRDQCHSGTRTLLAARHRAGLGTEHLGIRHLRDGGLPDTRQD